MALDLLKDRGVPLEQQRFTWKELVQPPYSKLDDDAFTRVRVILEAIRKPFSIVVHLSSSFLAVMKFRAAAWRESVQHQMEVTNLDHRCT
jgi:hypothetical protein